MRLCPVAVVAALLWAAGLATGQELWRIGDPDNSYDEFACARNYPAYSAAFPGDVTYTVGKSQARMHWSFIHPGPADAWAGSRVHPFTVQFDLPQAPRAPLRLAIDLVDVQGVVPSGLTVQVNEARGTFHLPNGNGDATLGDPARGREQVVSALLPAGVFRQGPNQLVITSTGSWFLYDCLALSVVGPGEAPRPRLRDLSAEPTFLFKRTRAGTPAQVVILRANTEGALEGVTLSPTLGGAPLPEVRLPACLSFGTLEHELLLPPVGKATKLLVQARADGSTETAQTEVTVKPERRWKVFIAPSVHTDIGYTDLQERVIERHNDNTDRALALCETFPAFGWDLEVAWQADMYRRERGEAQLERLYELARQGRVGLEAGYLNMLTGLCSHEELNRWLYYAGSLKRRYGVPLGSALISDVPTQVWSIPSTLTAAGIRYFATGINCSRANTFTTLQTGRPYWWEGPDGSRVLTYFAPGYAHAGGPLSSVAALRDWITTNTRGRETFPYDALYLYGAFGDNCPLDERIAATAQQWAEQYEYPKVILGPAARYFEYMERTYGPHIPVVRGDGGAYWEDGAASTAAETAANRRAHELASCADALAAIGGWLGGCGSRRLDGADTRPSIHAGRRGASRAELQDVWRNVLLFDEHTWGAWCSVSHPDDTQTVRQWAVKAGFAEKAARRSAALVDEGMRQLASQVRTAGPAVVLFNATSWERSGDWVQVALPEGLVPGDPDTGMALPAVREGRLTRFRAPRTPAWGCAVLPLVSGRVARPEPVSGEEALVLHNGRLRAVLDPQTGGLSSLADLATGRELVDQAAPYKLNEYLYVAGGDGSRVMDIGAPRAPEFTLHGPQEVSVRKERLPGLGERLIVSARANYTPRLELTYTLLSGSGRLDILNRLTRTETRSREAAYFAFPFAAREPQVTLEIPNGVMRPERDQLPGACRDWYCLQHWLRMNSREGGLAWASVDAPLLCLGDINRGQWRTKLEFTNGHVYSYIMNNYWFTNYKAGQGGEVEFRYSVSPEAGGSNLEAARFGWQAHMPMQATVIPGAQDGPLATGRHSFCSVRPQSVMVTAIKPAEEGKGVVVRLMSLGQEPCMAEVTLGIPGLRTAMRCNLLEEPQEALAMRERIVRVPVRPLTPTTVVLR